MVWRFCIGNAAEVGDASRTLADPIELEIVNVVTVLKGRGGTLRVVPVGGSRLGGADISECPVDRKAAWGRRGVGPGVLEGRGPALWDDRPMSEVVSRAAVGSPPWLLKYRGIICGGST